MHFYSNVYCSIYTALVLFITTISNTIAMIIVQADGTPFYNQFFVAALRDGNRRIVNFVGVQSPVTAPPPNYDVTEFVHSNQVRTELPGPSDRWTLRQS
jgi:hypothetical protein